MGNPGFGVDDLVPFVHERHDGEEDDRLPAGGDHHLGGVDVDVAGAANVLRHGLAKHRDTGRRDVVRVAFVHRVLRGRDDVRRSLEVGLPDLEVDDVLPLGLQRLGLRQDFERGLGSQTGHAGGELHGDLLAWAR